MATDMEHACHVDDELVDHRCDGCGGVLEPWDDEPPVVYDCFHVLHAGCADGHDACPRCHTPRRVHDDDPPEPVDEAEAAASPPDNNPDNDDDSRSGDETGEPRASRCDGDGDGDGDSVFIKLGENPASMLGSGCCCACSRRVTELESRLEEKSAALTETTNVLQSELERAQSRLCRLEEMYSKLEEEFVRLRGGKRAREIEDDVEERKKPRNGGRSVSSFPPQDQTE